MCAYICAYGSVSRGPTEELGKNNNKKIKNYEYCTYV